MKTLAVVILLAQIIGTWRTDMRNIGMGWAQDAVSVRGGKLIVAQTFSAGTSDRGYTAALPVASIACVRPEKTDIYIYGATQTSGTDYNPKTGKTTFTDYLFLSADNAAQTRAMLAKIESAVPRVRHVVNACKGPVDLYRLKFVPPVNAHSVTTGVYGNGGFMHGTYEFSANRTTLYYQDRAFSGGSALFSQLKELPFAQISCVFRHKDGGGLTIYSRIPDGVMGRDEKGATFSSNEMMVDTDGPNDTDDLLDALEQTSPVFKAKLGAC